MNPSSDPSALEAPKPAPISIADLVYVCAGICLILAIAGLLSRGRLLWEDEVLAWVLLRDPSWHHMLHAWELGADSGGIAFYATARAWFAVFKPSVQSFRMYSGAGFAAAFAVLWLTLRRFYSRWILALALLGVWFLGPQVVVHICEGRFYGLLMLSSILVFSLTVKVLQSPRSISTGFYVILFLCNAFLVTAHSLGIVYSAAMLSAVLLSDLLVHRPRPVLYATYVLPWMCLLPELTALMATVGVEKPRSWTSAPHLRQVISAYYLFDTHVAALLVLLLALCIVSWWKAPEDLGRAITGSIRTRFSLYLPVLALAVLPVLFGVKSQFGLSMWVNRYMLPVSIFTVVCAAELMRLTQWRLQNAVPVRTLRYAPAFASACALSLAFFWTFRHFEPELPLHRDYTTALQVAVAGGEPVVVDSPFVFIEIMGRQGGGPTPFLYLLNWQRTLLPESPPADVSQYHLMDIWRQAGYFSTSIRNEDEFLRNQPRFLLLETTFSDSDPEPVDKVTLLSTLRSRPDVEVSLYRTLKNDDVQQTVWLVQRSNMAGR